MAPTKLTESDKQDILTRYRQPEETTSTLASRYGVSTSTISRILKQNLSDEEYEILVQQKRSGINKTSVEQGSLILEETPAPAPVEVQPEPEPIPGQRRKRKRSTANLEPEEFEQSELPQVVKAVPAIPEASVAELVEMPREQATTELPRQDYVAQATAIEEILEDELIDEEDFDESEADDDLDDDDLDDDLDDDPEDEVSPRGIKTFTSVNVPEGTPVQVLPLTEAALPRTCYVVIDRSAELITRPLKDFADLGQIPIEETQEKTLPIFDNHRVAKRFLRRMQRVVKVPDGRVFQKVSPYLQAKGITRLLIDGQVYSLN
jgi:transposase-like protein